jgi:hypothetical protein
VTKTSVRVTKTSVRVRKTCQSKKNLSQSKKNLSQSKKNLSQSKKKLSQVKKNLSQSTVYILPKHPHITKPSQTHTHTHTHISKYKTTTVEITTMQHIDKSNIMGRATYCCYQPHTKCCPTFFCQGQMHIQTGLLTIMGVNIDIADGLRIVRPAFVKYYITMTTLWENILAVHRPENQQ